MNGINMKAQKTDIEQTFKPYILQIQVDTEYEHDILLDITKLITTIPMTLHDKFGYNTILVQNILDSIKDALNNRPTRGMAGIQ
jgi:hypothetical protein